MKRLIRRSELKMLPQIGEKSILGDDPQYPGVHSSMVFDENFRDGPIIIYEDKVYYGKSGQTHTQLMQEQNLSSDGQNVDFAFGYYLRNYFGQPAVFLDMFNSKSVEELAAIVKADRSDVNVFQVDKNDIFTRLAKT